MFAGVLGALCALDRAPSPTTDTIIARGRLLTSPRIRGSRWLPLLFVSLGDDRQLLVVLLDHGKPPLPVVTSPAVPDGTFEVEVRSSGSDPLAGRFFFP